MLAFTDSMMAGIRGIVHQMEYFRHFAKNLASFPSIFWRTRPPKLTAIHCIQTAPAKTRGRSTDSYVASKFVAIACP